MKTGKEIAALRVEYQKGSLEETEVHSDPMQQFDLWFQQALAAEIHEPNAMSLATSYQGQPTIRVVLLKSYDPKGFVFFTNYQSRKGQELAANPLACLNFFWGPLERQVRIEGEVEKISAEESEAYYNSRDKGSRIGAWASPQSQVLESREVLEERVGHFFDKYGHADQIPRPEHWGGYLLKPSLIEFWQGRPSRLHDRICYNRDKQGPWHIERLAP
jgi:pyridoxamine 5'-phosphate oxidase